MKPKKIKWERSIYHGEGTPKAPFKKGCSFSIIRNTSYFPIRKGKAKSVGWSGFYFCSIRGE